MSRATVSFCKVFRMVIRRSICPASYPPRIRLRYPSLHKIFLGKSQIFSLSACLFRIKWRKPIFIFIVFLAHIQYVDAENRLLHHITITSNNWPFQLRNQTNPDISVWHALAIDSKRKEALFDQFHGVRSLMPEQVMSQGYLLVTKEIESCDFEPIDGATLEP